jgi:acetyl/propionyl-CoA carboxylase alpha subunit
MKKLLIANRGEIACRIISSAKALGIGTVAVYSEADQHAMHVKMADEAIAIGPTAARKSYLVAENLIGAAKKTRAEAIHPGYGFLAESADFAKSVREAGLIWIGPRPTTIAEMGNKTRARDIALSSGLPVLAASPPFPPNDLSGLEDAAYEIGFPLLIKASAGGGGLGMAKIDEMKNLMQATQSTQSMAEKAFGDGTIYLEQYIPRARHIEVQVFGFGDGHAVHFYERDCSTQRRFQKVIEESPAPKIPDVVRQRMAMDAVELCHHVRYKGAGTVEFIVDADSYKYYFLEMNTRIQVEHPVTEMNTERDLVGLQILLASGDLQHFNQREIVHAGHSIECRIYAENPEKNFMPSPGMLDEFDWSRVESDVRVDTGFASGDEVTFFYDPMIAKVICKAETRDKALEKMIRTLDSITLKGLTTNLPFLKRIMCHRDFQKGEVFTGFIDQHKADLLTKA